MIISRLRELNNSFSKYETLAAAGLILAMAAAGVCAFAWSTGTFGVGLRTDSIAYIWAARDFAGGLGLGDVTADGIFRPMTHWPPLYPLLLSGFEATGIGAERGAALLGAALMGAMIGLFGILLLRVTHGSLWATGTGLLIFSLSPTLWATGLYAMSEPLYTVLFMLAFIVLDEYLRHGNRRWLFLTGLLLALAFASRYIGGALILALCAALFVQPEWTLRRKLVDVLTLASIAVLPMLLWVSSNYFRYGVTAGRDVLWQPITAGEWTQLQEAIGDWVRPLTAIPSMVSIKLLGVLVFGLGLGWALFSVAPPRGNRPQTYLGYFAALHGLSDLVFTGVARLWFDGSIPIFEPRILFPFYVCIFLLIVQGAAALPGWTRKHGIGPSLALLAIYIVLAAALGRGYFQASYTLLLRNRTSGLALASMVPAQSPLAAAIRQNEWPHAYFLTDDRERLYYLTGHASSRLGELHESNTAIINGWIHDRGVILVLFNRTRATGIMEEIPDFKLVFKGDDGALLIAPSAAGTAPP